MGTPLQVLRTQVQVSSQQQDDVQGRSTSPSHCCSICCSRGEVLMRGMCSRDARSGGDGEDGSYPHPRLHPRQLLPHPRLHRSSALLRDSLSKYYVGMLFGVVEHYFVDGALHVCQTAGTCSAREYTCDECIQGLEWVEMYLEDPIMIAEFRIYLEQNFCLSDWDDCKALVEEHFTGMHVMAMEKFFIPTEICMQEPVCGGSPTFPPKPTDGPDA